MICYVVVVVHQNPDMWTDITYLLKLDAVRSLFGFTSRALIDDRTQAFFSVGRAAENQELLRNEEGSSAPNSRTDPRETDSEG